MYSIAGIFEPKGNTASASDASSAGSAKGSDGSAAGSKAAGSKAAGSAGKTAAGGAGTAGTAGTAATGTAKRALHNFDAYAGQGHTVGVDKSGSMYDGYYSWSSQACPVCPNRRQLSENGDASSASGGGDSANDHPVGGMALGVSHNGRSKIHGPGHGPDVSASHFVDGHVEGATDPAVDEHSSFNDGFAVYARFFHPKGIAVLPDGGTIWVGDQGNNRIRNISCAGIGAPTFEPSAVPTHRPSAVPTFVPSAKPSAVPTAKPSAAAVVLPPKVVKPAPAPAPAPAAALALRITAALTASPLPRSALSLTPSGRG